MLQAGEELTQILTTLNLHFPPYVSFALDPAPSLPACLPPSLPQCLPPSLPRSPSQWGCICQGVACSVEAGAEQQAPLPALHCCPAAIGQTQPHGLRGEGGEGRREGEQEGKR